eukprot:TRINITY_DN10894_c0_g1_i1.p1 TRINITY_DN10894_c0_g1~~TRINITY_DN10894_c0_g1_i1.p1  ORF type:complete len:401 (+),score=80.51 TRINITY_DN10894_c0_g1_i1:179-1381(+)
MQKSKIRMTKETDDILLVPERKANFSAKLRFKTIKLQPLDTGKNVLLDASSNQATSPTLLQQSLLQKKDLVQSACVVYEKKSSFLAPTPPVRSKTELEAGVKFFGPNDMPTLVKQTSAVGARRVKVKPSNDDICSATIVVVRKIKDLKEIIPQDRSSKISSIKEKLMKAKIAASKSNNDGSNSPSANGCSSGNDSTDGEKDKDRKKCSFLNKKLQQIKECRGNFEEGLTPDAVNSRFRDTQSAKVSKTVGSKEDVMEKAEEVNAAQRIKREEHLRLWDQIEAHKDDFAIPSEEKETNEGEIKKLKLTIRRRVNKALTQDGVKESLSITPPKSSVANHVLKSVKGNTLKISVPQDTEIRKSTTRYDKSRTNKDEDREEEDCLLYTSPSPRDGLLSRMPSSA